MATLSYVNVFAKDIRALSAFYIQLFGFREIPEIGSPIFVGLDTGPRGSAIGFNAHDAYDLLKLSDHADTSGVKFLLNFELESIKDVDAQFERAVSLGANIIKPPYQTYYNWYQAVLMDIEGNVFRINHVLT